jgi:hypothetical protein
MFLSVRCLIIVVGTCVGSSQSGADANTVLTCDKSKPYRTV